MLNEERTLSLRYVIRLTFYCISKRKQSKARIVRVTLRNNKSRVDNTTLLVLLLFPAHILSKDPFLVLSTVCLANFGIRHDLNNSKVFVKISSVFYCLIYLF